jgi:PDZ domain
MRVSVTSGAAAQDIGLELFDCAGWSVDQWHAQGSDARVAALGDLDRVRVWMHVHPELAANVLGRGIAFDPSAPRPTYFFTLYKTNDGIMRALVRAGGPAWTAGLRTGDVVDKVDGKYWWEYGTYQTQLRAYDGHPHTFEVTRGAQHEIRVALGEPFRG